MLRVNKITKKASPQDLTDLRKVDEPIDDVSRYSWGDDVFEVTVRIGGIKATAFVKAPSKVVAERECQIAMDQCGDIVETKKKGENQ